MRGVGLVFFSTALALAAPSLAPAQEFMLPILVPLTGPIPLEGSSQRNGALLGLKHAPIGLKIDAPVTDTGGSPEQGLNAHERALGGTPTTIVASMLGTQLLAMIPVADEAKVPLVTISGTARITELGSRNIFRFFPADPVAKAAHVRYVVEELGRKRPAVIYQTTAYGQSGRAAIVENLAKHGLKPVFEEALDVAVKDMLPVIAKARAADPDVVMLHLHSAPSALFLKQAHAAGLALPIVAGSGVHQPSTAALLDPAELKGVCAETGSSPVSGGSPTLESWLAAYRAEFAAEPDAFALGQYDAVMMVLEAAAKGARTPDAVRAALAGSTYQGLAMTYKDDGKGNMAHSAMIVFCDGTSRVPKIAKRYDDIAG
jgi:branched-chain amino acid transport system substrate-binding protein